jgi:protein SCO1/2
MKRIAAITIVLLAACLPAWAGLPAVALRDVGVTLPGNASLPLSLRFRDEAGRTRTLGEAVGDHPALVVFADYTCTNLCGPILAFAADGLKKTKLVPGSDYRLIVIGLDPKDSLAAAETMKKSRIGSDGPLVAATVILRGDEATIHAATTAVGYRYTYDAEHDQFAHPAAAFVVTAKGRVTRVLSGLGLDGATLRLALVEAGQGKIGTFADHVRLLCYGFDPSTGVYTERITTWLAAGGALTVAVLFGSIGLMTLFSRRRARS